MAARFSEADPPWFRRFPGYSVVACVWPGAAPRSKRRCSAVLPDRLAHRVIAAGCGDGIDICVQKGSERLRALVVKSLPQARRSLSDGFVIADGISSWNPSVSSESTWFGTPSGKFWYTLTMTAVAAGWTVHTPLRNNAHKWVVESLERLLVRPSTAIPAASSSIPPR
jgi:hypothetical protein